MVRLIREIRSRMKWWGSADRLGPDIPTTHLKLFIPSLAKKLCQRKFAAFGSHSEFRPGAYAIACSKIEIGSNVVIRPQTMLFADFHQAEGRIHIEDDVLIGSGVHIYVTNHEYRDVTRLIREQGDTLAKPVRLSAGCWIGANAVILPGVTVGKHAVVGASSVVTRDVPDYSVVAGNPAQVIKTLKTSTPGGLT